MVLLHLLPGRIGERHRIRDSHWKPLVGARECRVCKSAKSYQAVIPPSTSKSAPVAYDGTPLHCHMTCHRQDGALRCSVGKSRQNLESQRGCPTHASAAAHDDADLSRKTAGHSYSYRKQYCAMITWEAETSRCYQ